MEMQKEELTQPIYNPKAVAEKDELWEVFVGKKSYQLKGSELNIIYEASISGNRGLVWFKDKAISVPHISAIIRIRKSPINNLSDKNIDKSNKIPIPLEVKNEIYRKLGR